MGRPIAISLSPNMEKDDVKLALNLLCSPSNWRRGSAISEIEQWFEKKYQGIAFSFNSARSAEMEILKMAAIENRDEVLVQAFTCVAVPNSVLWVGAKPVFVDIDHTFNMDVEDLEKKITPRSRAIIVQYTFGIPANIKKIKEMAQKHQLLLIEDCAHALGATVDGKLVGNFGDGAFFSFGRDKIISSVFGGMAVIKNTKLKKKNEKFYSGLSLPSNYWIFQQLLHPIIFNYLVFPLYQSGVGKLLLFISQQLNLLSRAVSKEEKIGYRPDVFPAKLPNALAQLAFNQLKKLERFNQHRQEIANLYFRELGDIREIKLPPNIPGSVWLRFPILTNRKRELLAFAKKNGILLGDWYEVVTPKESLPYLGYKIGSCPNAEDAASLIINLPTYPTLLMDDAQKVVQLIKRFFK